MNLSYYLRLNRLGTNTQAPYLPVTVSKGSLSRAEFVNRVSRRTTFTEHDVKGVLDSALDVLKLELQQGNSVQTDFGTFKASVGGVFTDLLDSFESARHRIRIKFRVNPQISRHVGDNSSVRQIENPKHTPILLSFKNIADSSETQSSAGALVRLEGRRLRFEAEDPLQGVFLVDIASNGEFKADQIGELTSSRIVLQLPTSLTAGQYRIAVRSKYGQQLREGRLDSIIEIL